MQFHNQNKSRLLNGYVLNVDDAEDCEDDHQHYHDDDHQHYHDDNVAHDHYNDLDNHHDYIDHVMLLDFPPLLRLLVFCYFKHIVIIKLWLNSHDLTVLESIN